MTKSMSDERLDRLAGLAELPCTCGTVDCEIYSSALTAAEAQELIAEVKRARAELAAREPLRPEFGVRLTYTSTRMLEAALSDDVEEARAIIAADEAENAPDVVSRALVQRPVGEWREMGDDRG